LRCLKSCTRVNRSSPTWSAASPLGLTVCWINRRSIDLHPSVPPLDHIFPDIRSLLPLLGI
jgi:hypothetical protein